jgi:hypothetical protein
MRRVLLFCFLSLVCAADAWGIDAFDRHTTFWLREGVKNREPVAELSSGQAAGLKTLSRGIASPCVIVKTNHGHWTKALLSWGVRKGAEGKVTPVLLIERYVTYDNDRPDLALASGKNVMLFAGFQFNFEIGQVVPAGQGGDITLGDDKRLRPVDAALVYTLDGSVLPPAEQGEKYDPAAHDGVSPRDFAGIWQLNADGRWRGTCTLVVEEDGSVQGSYVSDESKSVYPVRGQVGGLPHRMTLDIELANAVQSLEAFLWTGDKSTMAGTATLAERKFGFYAARAKADAAGQ